MGKPRAILFSDAHIRLNMPVARADKDWKLAQARPLRQIKRAALAANLPVFFAGDMFHKWNTGAEMINFAMDELPEKTYAVPGQHDLAYHDYKDLDRTAYGTLCKSKRIHNLGPENSFYCPDKLRIIAAPWQVQPAKVVPYRDSSTITLMVAHAYIWAKGHSYPGAGVDQKVDSKKFRKMLAGCDAAVFGDNHMGFTATCGKTTVFNHGGMMNVNSDEVHKRPGYGILHDDGGIVRVPYDISRDRWVDNLDEVKKAEVIESHVNKFIADLRDLGATELSFEDGLREYLRKYNVSKGAEKILLTSTEETNG